MEKNKNVLSEEARKSKNAYLRKWRSENKDKVAEYDKKYWEKQAEEQRLAEEREVK